MGEHLETADDSKQTFKYESPAESLSFPRQAGDFFHLIQDKISVIKYAAEVQADPTIFLAKLVYPVEVICREAPIYGLRAAT